MDVLHLTDLHVTEPGETLETLWPREMLEGRQFDAIIVSGDLTQRAEPREYRELHRFTEQYLLPLLRKKERGRVIFTPGNHDVSWGKEVGLLQGQSFVLSSSKRKLRQKLIEDFGLHQRDPANSALRMEFTEPGRYALYRVDPDSARYRERFRPCQTFLDGFYTEPGLTLKPFNLLGIADDWSAHVLHEEKVVFFGFNSCHGNDKRWPVARIDHRSIAKAANWRQDPANKCSTYLAVAVWHHGFTAQHGRPDFLSFDDLGRLQDAGFRIGFHGHVHASAVWALKQLRDDFALIATGSLGAGASERPDAVGQQFSIVQLYPSRVTVDVYERNQPHGKQYQLNERASRRLYLQPPGTSERRASHIAKHLRTWTVREDGIIDVKVELTDVTTDGNMVLDILSPPYCNFNYDERADTDGQPARILADSEGSGRRRFVLLNAKPSYQKLHWSYTVSNAVVMNQAELRIMEPIQNWYPNVQGGFDLRCHVVRHECDRLWLRLEFNDARHGAQPGIAEARALVESKLSDEPWEVVKEEQSRCVVRLDPSGQGAELEVSAPVMGLRYGLMFRPKEVGTPIPPQAMHLSTNLLRRCREGLRENAFSRGLSDVIQDVIFHEVVDDLLRDEVLKENGGARPKWNGDLLGEGGAWLGLLWNGEDRRLLPAFGRFRLESWGSRFAAGNGVAGHAFRRCGTTAWFENKGRSDLIFQDEVEPYRFPTKPASSKQKTSEPRYRWIVCVPIYLSPKGAAIGVVSFAGKEATTLVARKLEDFAHRLVHEPDAPEVAKFTGWLENTLNGTFWTAIVCNQDLEKTDREVAKNFLRQANIDLRQANLNLRQATTTPD